MPRIICRPRFPLRLPAGKRVVVVESRVIGSGITGKSLGDMTVWHTGMFSSLERWTSTDQRKQVRRHARMSGTRASLYKGIISL